MTTFIVFKAVPITSSLICGWRHNQVFPDLPIRFMRQKRIDKIIPITFPINFMKKQPCYPCVEERIKKLHNESAVGQSCKVDSARFLE